MTLPADPPSSTPREALRYEQTGVDYGTLDTFKRACQQAAATTTGALAAHGLSEPAGVRGESAYLLETADGYLAHVEEGLGTKNLVADAMLRLTGRSFYRNIGIDTVATIVNDLVTCGALPISVAMHAAVGDSGWFAEGGRAHDLAEGFAEGCRQAGAVWGGGETPALQGIVEPGAIVLAGSAIGRISSKSHRIVGDVRDGDAIVLLASSGVQTNGLSLCRALAERLPDGYLTPVGDGRTYGEALLDASVIYVRFVAECQRQGLRLHYAAHVTGHGWRKLMRLDEPFVYRLTDLGGGGVGGGKVGGEGSGRQGGEEGGGQGSGGATPPVVFDFIRRHGPVELREAYATFNMGVGFAAYVGAADADRCAELARRLGYGAWVGGFVRKEGGRKAVEIVPLGLTFEGETLQVR